MWIEESEKCTHPLTKVKSITKMDLGRPVVPFTVLTMGINIHFHGEKNPIMMLQGFEELDEQIVFLSIL